MKARHRNPLWYLLGIPALCCFGGLLVIKASSWTAERRLEAEITDARRTGLPTTAQDLDAVFRVPPGEDAGAVYIDIDKLLRNDKVLEADLRGYIRASGPEQPIRSLLERARAASTMPHCRLTRSWPHQSTTDYSNRTTVRFLALAFAEKAMRQDKRNDVKGALDSLGTARRICEQLGEEPVIVPATTRAMCEDTILRDLARLLERHWKDVAVQDFCERFLDDSKPYLFKQMVAVDFGSTWQDVQKLNDRKSLREVIYDETLPTADRVRLDLQASQVAQAMRERYIREITRLYRAMPLDPKDLDGAVSVVRVWDHRAKVDTSLSNYLVGAAAPTLSQVGDLFLRVEALRRLLKLEVDLFRVRSQTGSLPKWLPHTDAETVDPFTGKPLVYRKTPNGFLAYSLGENRYDDGGWQGKARDRGDVVVQYSE